MLRARAIQISVNIVLIFYFYYICTRADVKTTGLPAADSR